MCSARHNLRLPQQGRSQQKKARGLQLPHSMDGNTADTTGRYVLHWRDFRSTLEAQVEPVYTLDAKLVDLDVGRAIDKLAPAKRALLEVHNSELWLPGQGFT